MSARHNLIRTIVSTLGCAAAFAPMCSACAWVITAASLGTFLAFCVWLLGLALYMLAQDAAFKAVRCVLTDERIDRATAWLGSIRNRLTA